LDLQFESDPHFSVFAQSSLVEHLAAKKTNIHDKILQTEKKQIIFTVTRARHSNSFENMCDYLVIVSLCIYAMSCKGVHVDDNRK